MNDAITFIEDCLLGAHGDALILDLNGVYASNALFHVDLIVTRVLVMQLHRLPSAVAKDAHREEILIRVSRLLHQIYAMNKQSSNA